MPMKNSLNVSELLKRLGVVGDSMGSADLLDAMRMTVQIADLSALVPPVGTPITAVSSQASSGAGNNNKWTLHCRSPGGLRVNQLEGESGRRYRAWVTTVDPFVGSVAVAPVNLSFEQVGLSVFFNAPAAPPLAPANALRLRGPNATEVFEQGNWIGPGEFLNFEATSIQVAAEILTVTWREYPAMINP